MKKIGFIVQFLCLALFSFGQSAGDGIRFIEGEKWENVLKMAQEQDKYIFMDCYTSWCGPCKMVAPVLEELAAEYDGQIYVYKVNTEQEQELAALFNIRSIPSFLFIPMNDKPQMAMGAMPKSSFKEAIDGVLLKK